MHNDYLSKDRAGAILTVRMSATVTVDVPADLRDKLLAEARAAGVPTEMVVLLERKLQRGLRVTATEGEVVRERYRQQPAPMTPPAEPPRPRSKAVADWPAPVLG